MCCGQKDSAAIAQLVARGSHNPKVVSSILTGRIWSGCLFITWKKAVSPLSHMFRSLAVLFGSYPSQRQAEGANQNAHAGSRTRVTSMGGLYDTVTLHARDNVRCFLLFHLWTTVNHLLICNDFAQPAFQRTFNCSGA